MVVLNKVIFDRFYEFIFYKQGSKDIGKFTKWSWNPNVSKENSICRVTNINKDGEISWHRHIAHEADGNPNQVVEVPS